MAKQINCNSCGKLIYKGAKTCPHCGKKNKKPIGLIIIGVIAFLTVIALSFGKAKNSSEKKVTYKWPSNGIAAVLPVPNAEYGRIYSESEDYFRIELYFISQSDFDIYIEECRESGFEVDYHKTDSYYFADDNYGNHLKISFEDNEMDISILAAEDIKEDSKIENHVGGADEKDETNSSVTGQVDSADEESEGDSNIENGEGGISETDSENESEGMTDTGTFVEENVEFRTWVDSYEAFMNRYVDFMKKYDSMDPSAFYEYTELITKYAEFIDATDKLNEDDYSLSDWAYYTDAQARILMRMNELQ